MFAGALFVGGADTAALGCPSAERAAPSGPTRALAGPRIMALNDRQREAVEHGDGALLVLAGAGSGKTRVLVHRIARLIETGQAEPWEILAVTFTNKAARELVGRCEALIGPQAAELWVGTFHGIGARLCRRHAERLGYPQSFTIFDNDDQLRLLKELAAAANLDDTLYRADALRGFIDRAKNEAAGPEETAKRHTDSWAADAAKIYERYSKRLMEMGAMDFGDLILNPLRLLREHEDIRERYQRRFRHVHVDEYQDTNHTQYLMVSLLAGGYDNLCVVGDDDQSIYGWRGADIRNILEFERDFPGAHVVRLEQNYRSTGNIIEASAAVIDNNSDRRAKHMWTSNEPGEPLVVYTAADEKDEARFITDGIRKLGAERGRAAVFYRTNAQSRALEESLVYSRIPYVIVGSTRFYERREIKDLIAYLRFVHNPADDLSLERIINVPARGIGKVSWERLRAAARKREVPVWETLCDQSYLGVVGGAARTRMAAFCELASQWVGCEYDSVTDLLRSIIDETGYFAFLEGRPDDDPVGRTENVQELVTVAQNFDTDPPQPMADAPDDEALELPPLARWLEQLALASDLDGYQAREQAVTLMTVHNSKGLEFNDVFIAGVEEGIFPHARSLGDDDGAGAGVEEERRLCYVGMTRAMQRLTLTHARRRHVFGSSQYNLSSRFLDEIPDNLVKRRASRLSSGEAPDSGFWANSSDSGGGSAARRRPEAWNEPEFREPPVVTSTSGQYRAGMKVVHPMFGVGTVRQSDGNGENEKLVVQFQRAGVKKLVARFARLEIV